MAFQAPLIETDRDVLQTKIAAGSEKLYAVAKAAYGPKAGNVMLGFKHGAPLLSRDGVTNLKQVRAEDQFEDDAIQAIQQVSDKNNKNVGDGTTAVVILTHHLLMAAQRLEGKGYNPMEIVTKLKEAEQAALSYVESIRVDLGKKLPLEEVATIAAGDPELGAMISDIMKTVGKDGGVLIEQYDGLGVIFEIVDGFYFGKGYKDADLINNREESQSNHKDVAVVVSNVPFITREDIGPILKELIESGFKEAVIIGEVVGEALQTLKMTHAKGLLLAVPVDPPYVVGGRSIFLDDVALMVGAEVFNGDEFSANMMGHAKEILVNEWSTSIMGGDSDKSLVKERVKSLRKQVIELDHPGSIQFAKDRLARLAGKMALIKVGGAIEFEREETKLRVQDAVCAVQSSMKEGVLPGGGVVLARVSGTEFDDAFKQPFKQLAENAGLNPEAYLAKLDLGEAWDGFNFKRLTDKPINLLEEGVLDATLVVKEIIRNSVSVVSGLITASAAIVQRDKD